MSCTSMRVLAPGALRENPIKMSRRHRHIINQKRFVQLHRFDLSGSSDNLRPNRNKARRNGPGAIPAQVLWRYDSVAGHAIMFRRLSFKLKSGGHFRVLVWHVHFQREDGVAQGGVLFRDDCGVPVVKKDICEIRGRRAGGGGGGGVVVCVCACARAKCKITFTALMVIRRGQQ